MTQGGKWRYVNWKGRKIGHRFKSIVYGRLYQNVNPDPAHSILVSGSARSGTTWLAQLLSTALEARILFEPFNTKQVESYSTFNYFQYMRSKEPDEALEAFCRRVITGTIRHPWIDRQVNYLKADYRVIKAIRANLLLNWLNQRFPTMPQVLIIRHPCAVVRSRMQLGWDTDGDIDPMLSQPKLVEDFLEPFLDVIGRARTAAEKHAVIWSVTNLVPLNQFKDGGIHLVFYEHLCTQPEIEMQRLFSAINKPYNEELLTQLARPSATVMPASAILTGENQLTGWQSKLSSTEIEQILKIVEGFGLDRLYNDSALPLQN